MAVEEKVERELLGTDEAGEFVICREGRLGKSGSGSSRW
jgi:hypothetical protein